MYELIAGRPAFDGDSIPAICAQVLEQAPLPLGDAAPHVPAARAHRPALLEQRSGAAPEQRSTRSESLPLPVEAAARTLRRRWVWVLALAGIGACLGYVATRPRSGREALPDAAPASTLEPPPAQLETWCR